MTKETLIELERMLRPVLATIVSELGGGQDSHGHRVPGIDERLATIHKTLITASVLATVDVTVTEPALKKASKPKP